MKLAKNDAANLATMATEKNFLARSQYCHIGVEKTNSQKVQLQGPAGEGQVLPGGGVHGQCGLHGL